eukprot:2894015-Pyramimonas_sp.AAC.1
MSCKEVEGGWEKVRSDYEQGCEEDEEEMLYDSVDLRHLVRSDKAAMLQYLRHAKRRRAWPQWGLPSEASLLILAPNINMKGPNRASEVVAERMARAAEEDEEEQAKQQEQRMMKKGMALLRKMGWSPGE